MEVVGPSYHRLGSNEQFRVCMPDITLLDLRLPDMTGIDVMRAIHSEFPDARVIMLTTFGRRHRGSACV